MDRDLSQLLDDAYSDVGTAFGRADRLPPERQAELLSKAQELCRLARELEEATRRRV